MGIGEDAWRDLCSCADLPNDCIIPRLYRPADGVNEMPLPTLPMSLQVNLEGAVRNLRVPEKDGALLPLFEAVSNAIHAIQDRRLHEPDWNDGQITVSIKRSNELSLGDTEDERLAPINDVEIEDNGIGFNDPNLQSFQSLYSAHKAARGARGFGRLVWLKTYGGAEVTSRFRDDGGRLHLRKFHFTQSGIGNLQTELAPGQDANPGTRVCLLNCKEKYARQGLKQVAAIARRLLEDCLEIYLVGSPPNIVVTDGVTTYSLSGVFAEMRGQLVQTTEIHLGQQKLRVDATFLKTKDAVQQSVHLCAAGRSVMRIPLADFQETLSKPLLDQGQSTVLVACVSGPLLDEAVNNERTGFDLPTDGDLALDGRPTLSEIKTALKPWVETTTAPYAEAAERERADRLDRFIEEHPWYKILGGTYRERLSKVRTDKGAQQLDMDLFKVMQEIREETREQMRDVVESLDAETDTTVAEKTEKLAAKVGTLAASDLARYVCERRAVLDVLDRLLGRTSDGKRHLEEAVHDLVFPMKVASDQVPHQRNHLWLVDERLSFHAVLRSDLENGEARERPDLIVGHRASLDTVLADVGEPLRHVVIVEFKRPERAGYPDDGNPMKQVRRYAKEARLRGIERFGGTVLRTAKDARFDAYIVASITPKLKELALDEDMTETDDGLGFFKFHKNDEIYIEVVDFQKLVRDARKRNAAILDKLGILN